MKVTAQTCQASDRETNPNSYVDACQGTYPGTTCTQNRLACQDTNIESPRAQTNQYCGDKGRYYNTSVTNCQHILNVQACHRWRITATNPTNCDISISQDGNSWNQISNTCYTTYPTTQCTDVTTTYTWTCNNFFGTTPTGPYIRQNAMSNQNNKNCNTDALYYSITYT